jgi:methyltransferase (TIGR00027 family)
MDDTHARKSSLRDAILIACCQRNSQYAKLLKDPRDLSPRWFAGTHSMTGRLAVMCSGIPGLSGLIFSMWQKTVPGGLLHLLARRRFVEDQVRESIKGGIRQIVLFGSGYDSLGLRLAKEFHHIQVFEVDHPPTQATKRLAVETKMIMPTNLHFLPVDLRKGTLERHLLQAKGYDTHLHVLFVAERVLPYLPDSEVDEIFNFAYEHGITNSRFIFSVVDKTLLNDPSSFLYQEARKAEHSGRPIRSSLHLEEIEKFLFQRGLKGVGFANDEFITEQYLKPAGFRSPPVLGEMVVVAEKADWAKWMLSRKPQITQLFNMTKPGADEASIQAAHPSTRPPTASGPTQTPAEPAPEAPSTPPAEAPAESPPAEGEPPAPTQQT